MNRTELTARAQLIKNATKVDENSATRVGGVLQDIIDSFSLKVETYSVTDPLRLEFDSSLGWSLAVGEETVIGIRVFNGWTDLTSYIDSCMWMRDSGDVADDAVWNIAHSTWGVRETLSYSDLGSTLNTRNKCVFTITVTYDDEGVSNTLSNTLTL